MRISSKVGLMCAHQVRYDLRGHGRSGMPAGIKGYRSSLWADDYAAVLKAFGLTK